MEILTGKPYAVITGDIVGSRKFPEKARRDLHAVMMAGAAALAIHNFRLTQQVVTQERERHELELAAQIQRQLLPPAEGSDFPVHGINMAARSVSLSSTCA